MKGQGKERGGREGWRERKVAGNCRAWWNIGWRIDGKQKEQLQNFNGEFTENRRKNITWDGK